VRDKKFILTVIIISIISTLTGGGIRQSPPTIITGKEKRESWIQSMFDDWLVLSLPGMDNVLVATDKYHTKQFGQKVERNIDIYYPPNFDFTTELPAVFVCNGTPEWRSNISLGQLIAVSGLIAVIPDTIDFPEVFDESIIYFSKNAKAFGINKKHIGIYSSGHSVPPALAAALEKSKKYHKYVQCAVFRSAVLQYGSLGRSYYDKSKMSNDVPLLIIKAKVDRFPEVNETHKLFLEIAHEMDMTVEYIEHEGGGHNWAIEDDTHEARKHLQKELDFLTSHLL
jgi:hypothetical protein